MGSAGTVTFAEFAGVDWVELRAAVGTVWDFTWVWALIAAAAAVCLYGGRVWRSVRRHARHMPAHLPRPGRQRVRPERFDALPDLPPGRDRAA